jgi:SNF2 family DNA or RNA helicase
VLPEFELGGEAEMKRGAARWVIRDGRIALEIERKILKVPAVDIARAEFKGATIAAGARIDHRPSEDLKIKLTRFPPQVVIRVTEPSDDLAVLPTLELAYQVSNALLECGVEQGEDQALVDGTWYPLPVGKVDTTFGALRECGIDREGPLTIRQYLDLRKSDRIVARYEPPPTGTVKADVAPVESTALKADLYPYQARGAGWLLRFIQAGIGCILADEMGLGKTLQIIAALCKDRETFQQPSLVVAPSTVLENWRRELVRFNPGANVLVHRGAIRTGSQEVLNGFDVVLTSYETAVRDSVLFESVQWRVVVADEAQAIKNPGTERALALKALPRFSAVAMTGTPVENRLRDLWSLADFAAPGYLGGLADFEAAFQNEDEDAKRLGERVRPLILRRLVKDVAKDLPPRLEVPQPLELGPAAADYEELKVKATAESGPLGALQRLRQFCAHPFVLSHAKGDPAAISTKYARFVELLEEIVASGEKVLVFAPYRDMLTLIATDIPRRLGIPATVLDGSVDVPLRQLLVDEFSAYSGAALLALNPRAGGAGLNIAAANHVIHYALEWNPAVEDQATARSHRRGQVRPVTVHRLYYLNTVEDYITSVAAAKRSLAHGAVVGTKGDALDPGEVAKALAMSPLG